MPSTNLFGDLELDRTMDGPHGLGSSGLVDNERNAYKLAFELSLLGMTNDNGYGSNVEQDSPGPMGFMSNPLSGVGLVEEVRSKKSQNMTECVPVPSSEHVAEIVGRQGCKIKALRAKTNTYIKTPVRGEEPVFVVTGRKEDVGKAKREILSAAEHFSQIRASRKNNLAAVTSGASTPPGPPTNIPGQITIQVRVPYRVVGLVVGPKGATIKRIQHQTHTYIVTPSRDKEPVFEVSGLPESVESAKREIESHIALRTGNGTSINGLGNGLDLIDDSNIFMQMCKNNSGYSLSNIFNNMDLNDQMTQNLTSSTGSLSGSGSCSSSSSCNGGRDITNIWGSADEGLGDSPSFETAQLPNIWSYAVAPPARPSPADSTSPVDSLLSSSGLNNHEMQHSNGLNNHEMQHSNGLNNHEMQHGNGLDNHEQSNNTSTVKLKAAKCSICTASKVTHAFIPCGHNFFCRECSNRVCGSNDPLCPYCSMPARQTIRIISPNP